MLIVNADDFGKAGSITDNILMCFNEGRVTSTSAMVFMEDSERAARLALDRKLEVGLHLNFDDPFTCQNQGIVLKKHHERIGAFLRKNKYSHVLYNPLLRRQFEYLYRAQYEEFLRLYREPPAHINGHHHMHLCGNILFGNIIPRGSRVRRTFTFFKGERPPANRLYRRFVDAIIIRRFVSTDMFFAAKPTTSFPALRSKAQLAGHHNVELMVHVSSHAELEFLMQPSFGDMLLEAPLGTYRDIPQSIPSNGMSSLS